MKALAIDETPNDTVEIGKPRECLSCSATFASVWAGDRICKKCKQSSAWRAGVAYRPGRVD